VDDPELIRAEIAQLQREIDETAGRIRARLDVRRRIGAAVAAAGPAIAGALHEAATASPGAPSAGADLMGRASRVSAALRGQPLAAAALVAAGGILWAVLTAPGG
jgi:hypothetical protein